MSTDVTKPVEFEFASDEARDKFIEHAQGWIKQRQAFDTERQAEEFWSLRERGAYAQGFSMAFGIALSMTDSRVANGAQYRIVDMEGKVIPFYKGNEHDGDGLITSIFNGVNT